ncbi:RNA-binding protein [Bacteroidia bacterium]|nr:RNA-binding protein [Bacteroidia bacterium]
MYSILAEGEKIMFIDPIRFISDKTAVSGNYIQNIVKLLDEGGTVPFIARYRKEMTGCMDEVKIEEVKEVYRQFSELEKRKTAVLDSIREQEKLTPALEADIKRCTDLRVLEDLYLPYKPKKQTRATKAKELGLEPLAAMLMKQENGDIFFKAQRFVKEGVKDEEAALQGARDIIAEWLSENERSRDLLRRFVEAQAEIYSKIVKGKEKEGETFSDYFDFADVLRKSPSHRILAIRRGEKEGFLRIGLRLGAGVEEQVSEQLERLFVKAKNESAEQVAMALKDAYKRLLFPSIESEYMTLYKQKADEEAIKVFAENLKQLLLASPLGNKRVLAVDPGYRTGCKVVCLDETGNLLHNTAIYPHPPQMQSQEAAAAISHLLEKYKIDAIAIGNGTAGRETEKFIRDIPINRPIEAFMVNESGASIYSASAIAREEFPDYDITVRGAVSIGRRLMDPLAELVKLDPKSIGVGQYQHDVDQTKLKESLDTVVVSCVNKVGVNVNTAGKHLLMHVSGLGPVLAENITAYIRENGAFKSRSELKKVKRMGEKAFQQCAGFLRIAGASYPLDNSSVHPESYHIVEKMAKDAGYQVTTLIGNLDLCSKINIKNYVTAEIGIPTLQDIVKELKKPGRDPRSLAQAFSFSDSVHTINDLQEGMLLPGIVTNITSFGAFIDIGVKQDGLVHISEIANRYISNPSEVLSLNQQLQVKVLQVDMERKRISLSVKQAQ